MAHFYDCIDNAVPSLRDDVTTPNQARKAGPHVYPSVTTVLDSMKDPFIDGIWKPRQIVAAARDYPDLSWDGVMSSIYGHRIHPTTGEEIPSSEFGTGVHKAIEMGLLGEAHHDTYAPWAEPFLDWVDQEGVQVIAAELVTKCDRMKIAGSIDFVGQRGKEVMLMDYKTRVNSVNTRGKPKVYTKDLYQLAIEAYMLKREAGLKRMPTCTTVVIDCDTKDHIHHRWTGAEVRKAIRIVKTCAKLYHLTAMA